MMRPTLRAEMPFCASLARSTTPHAGRDGRRPDLRTSNDKISPACVPRPQPLLNNTIQRVGDALWRSRVLCVFWCACVRLQLWDFGAHCRGAARKVSGRERLSGRQLADTLAAPAFLFKFWLEKLLAERFFFKYCKASMISTHCH